MKIRRKRHHSVPSLNMASMPDLIFTVLFFFMIVTHMRTETPKVRVETPEGTELTKAARKRSIVNLYIGTASNGNTHIQIGQHIIPLSQVGPTIQMLKNRLNEEDSELFTVNIKADKQTPMGVVSDVKQELRKVGALTIRYSATETK